MKVVLRIANTQRWEALAERIEGHAVSDLTSVAQEGKTFILNDNIAIPEIVELLENSLVKTVVVLYQQAEHHLAESLRQGASFDSAAAQWKLVSGELLQLQRKSRARLKLVNIEQAFTNPDDFTDQLAALGVSAKNALEDGVIQDVTLLAACQYVAQLPEIVQVNSLLQASSLLLQSNNKVLVDVESIISADATAVLQLKQAFSELETLTVEHSMLHVEFEETQQKNLELSERYNQDKQIHEDKIVKLKSELASSVHNLKRTFEEKDLLLLQLHQLKETEEENSILLEKLHQVQEELEKIFLDKKRAIIEQKQKQRDITKLEHRLRNTTADLASKNYRLDIVAQDVAEMKRSVFWKTGAPVRAVSNVFNKSKKRRQKLQKEVEQILSSEFFDAQWYLIQYPDVAESTISPAEHYLRFGAEEERFPGPLFSGTWYTETYPDVAASGMNPLLHYIKFGKAEGRTASVKLLQDFSKRVEE